MSASDVFTEKKRSATRGIVLGAWDEDDLPEDLTQRYVDPADRA